MDQSNIYLQFRIKYLNFNDADYQYVESSEDSM